MSPSFSDLKIFTTWTAITFASLFAACSSDPKPIPDSDLGELNLPGRETIKRLSALYENSELSNLVPGQLVFSSYLLDKNLDSLYASFNQTPARNQVGAFIVAVSQLTDQEITKANYLYNESLGWVSESLNPFSEVASATLMATCMISGKSLDEIQSVYKAAAGDVRIDVSAMLTQFSILGQVDITTINEMYNKASGTGEASAFLVLASILSKTSIDSLNQLFDERYEKGAINSQLIILSLVHGQSLDSVHTIFSKARGSGLASINLTQAALISDRPIEEINSIYDQIESIREDGPSMVVLAICAKAALETKHFQVFPTAYYDRELRKFTDPKVFFLLLPKKHQQSLPLSE